MLGFHLFLGFTVSGVELAFQFLVLSAELVDGAKKAITVCNYIPLYGLKVSNAPFCA
jgi:hypothetical protein